MTATLADVRSRLEAAQQEHLLAYFDELPPDAQQRLLDRLAALDLERVPQWVEQYVRRKPDFAPAGAIEPAPYYPRDPKSAKRPWDRVAISTP